MFQVSHHFHRMQRTAVQRLEHVERVDLTGSEARRDVFFWVGKTMEKQPSDGQRYGHLM